jgi:hypothetical protein
VSIFFIKFEHLLTNVARFDGHGTGAGTPVVFFS